MSKITLVAEKINDEAKFIKNLRQITNKSIFEIKEDIRTKRPFFEGMLSGNNSDETEEIVKKIIHFTNQNDEKIRLFIELDKNNPETNDRMYEITPQMFENMLEADKESEKYLADLDEQEANE